MRVNHHKGYGRVDAYAEPGETIRVPTAPAIDWHDSGYLLAFPPVAAIASPLSIRQIERELE
jgi:hypothetical protein